MTIDPSELSRPADQTSARLAGTRSQSMQRLQVGLFGLTAMVLLVGLANIVINNAKKNEAGVVPEAAPTVAASGPVQPASDPLADAGVVPAMPSTAEPRPRPPATTETINVPDLEAP